MILINHLLLHYTLSVVYNWVICRVQIRCLLLHPSSSCDFTTSAICSSTYHHIAYIGLVQLQPPKTWGVIHSKEQHCTVCLPRIPKCAGGQCTTMHRGERGPHCCSQGQDHCLWSWDGVLVLPCPTAWPSSLPLSGDSHQDGWVWL